jgi:hypothetical protein
VADEYGFKSSQAPTAFKDFAPKVKSSYQVHAPVVRHTVETAVVPQPPVVETKSVDYAYAPASAAAPAVVYHSVPVVAKKTAYVVPAVASSKQTSFSYAEQPIYRSQHFAGYSQPTTRYFRRSYPAYYSSAPVRSFGYNALW